jgi:hypothetical protein
MSEKYPHSSPGEHRSLPHDVESDIACHPEKPWLKAVAPVVGVTSLQDPEPRFLHQVVHSVASAQQEDEIANKPVLVLPDQRLKDSDIFPAQSKRDSLRIAFHARPQGQLILEHTLGIRMRNLKLRKVKPVAIGNEEIGRARQRVSIYVNWIPTDKSASRQQLPTDEKSVSR